MYIPTIKSAFFSFLFFFPPLCINTIWGHSSEEQNNYFLVSHSTIYDVFGGPLELIMQVYIDKVMVQL